MLSMMCNTISALFHTCMPQKTSQQYGVEYKAATHPTFHFYEIHTRIVLVFPKLFFLFEDLLVFVVKGIILKVIKCIILIEGILCLQKAKI